jgi:hypothetical protein
MSSTADNTLRLPLNEEYLQNKKLARMIFE